VPGSPATFTTKSARSDISRCKKTARLFAPRSPGSQRVSLFEAFYRSGVLVFGGGHVVLSLLPKAFVTPGCVSDNTLLAGRLRTPRQFKIESYF
jgi:hypothetical protein